MLINMKDTYCLKVTLLVTLLILFLHGGKAYHLNDIEIYNVTNGSDYGADSVVQYVLYNDGVTFNHARAVCQKIGGDLAQIETIEKRLWISTLIFNDNKPGENIFSRHVWIGLANNFVNNPVWIKNCSEPDYDNNPVDRSWKFDFKCYVMKTQLEFQRADCTAQKAFLCEVYSAVNVTQCDVDPDPTAYTDNGYPSHNCSAQGSICISVRNVTTAEAAQIADELSRKLTVDVTTTSSFRRRLECADDRRPSSVMIGYTGVVLVVVPLGVVFVSDIITMLAAVRHYSSIFNLPAVKVKK